MSQSNPGDNTVVQDPLKFLQEIVREVTSDGDAVVKWTDDNGYEWELQSKTRYGSNPDLTVLRDGIEVATFTAGATALLLRGALDLTGMEVKNIGDITDNSGNTVYDFSAGQVPTERTEGTSLTTVESGSVTLSSGSATIDTGVATSNTATFTVALGPDTDDADISAEVRADSGSGNYEVDLVETQDTAVGNPTIEYDILRVR
jgi:hypothetical protein